MARFYHFTHEDMLNMDSHSFYSYYKSIDHLEASELRMMISSTSYPWAKKEEKKSIMDKLVKRSIPRCLEQHDKVLTSEQVHNILKGMLNG